MPTADPDNDGNANLLEYVMNTDPLQATGGSILEVSSGSDGTRLEWSVRDDLSQTQIRLEGSPDLRDWSNLGEALENQSMVREGPLRASSATLPGNHPARYVRVRIEQEG